MAHTTAQEMKEGLVSVSITPRSDGDIDVEIIDGRFSNGFTRMPGQRIFAGNRNGGDSIEETHLYAEEPNDV